MKMMYDAHSDAVRSRGNCCNGIIRFKALHSVIAQRKMSDIIVEEIN